ncbi:hypothetical protein GWK47_027479 [Chionoecetes opilio]|uniref:Uncharacterized protein n=1 Tax=Chionoecetes opilio TaxID=41210 RepID=A0A8J8WNF2_CHIOP|nr:hypothetical protein GWK47_027479 [Chionoecetes opilio]
MMCACEHGQVSGVVLKCTCEQWQRVMHNVMYFLYKVLPGASSRARWTREGVDRAVSWGRHCEKAVARFGRTGTLRASITTLARRSHQIGSFRDLLSARRLLLGRLLQNQRLEEGVKEYVVQVSRSILGAEQASRVELAAQQQQQHATRLLSLLQKARHSNIRAKVKARLMLEAEGNAEPQDMRQSLSRMAHYPVSLRTTLVAALVEGDDPVVEAGPVVAGWVEERLTSPHHGHHRSVLKCFCSLSPHLLSKALARHTQLTMAVLECLHRDLLNFQPKYDADGCRWLPRGPTVLTWEELVKIYSVLASQRSMATRVQEAVEGWSMLEGGAVWGEVVRHARATRTPASAITSGS